MSLEVADFGSGTVFEQLKAGIFALPEDQRKKLIKQTKGIFELAIKNNAGKSQSWTIDFKGDGDVYLGKAKSKADIVINTTDETFLELAAGKINGQKAFMTGKIKVTGNIMLATKLDNVLKVAKKSTGGSAPAKKTAANVPSTAAPAKSESTPVAKSSSVSVPGFESSSVFEQISSGFASTPEETKAKILKQIKSIFQFNVKNSSGKVQSWYLDLKNSATVQTTATSAKPNIVISINDSDFLDLASGKLNGQKAFMTGKLKIKGNIMLATKLDTVFKQLRPKAKI